jgi:hypothetical protein
MSDSAQPLNFSNLFAEARQEFGSPDRGFFRTAWMMATAPGATLRAVFRGDSADLTRPVRYFLLEVTLYGLVYVSSGAIGIVAADTGQQLADQLNTLRAAHGNATPISAADIARVNPLTYYLQYPLVAEVILAIVLWLTSWPALARMGLSGTERLGATLYLYGTFNLLQIPLVVLVFAGRTQELQWILGAALVVYLAWAVHGMAPTPRRWTFLRGIAWYLLLQGFSGLIIGASMVVAMVRFGVGDSL